MNYPYSYHMFRRGAMVSPSLERARREKEYTQLIATAYDHGKIDRPKARTLLRRIPLFSQLPYGPLDCPDS